MKLQASDLANLQIRDSDFISTLAFFTSPAGGPTTIVVDGMERSDSISLTPSQVSEVRLNNHAY